MALVRLFPAFKGYLWSGTKLKEDYNKETDLSTAAESWELPTHKDGQSIADSGEYKRLTLNEYVEKLGKDVLGTEESAFEFFPILIRFIDAKDNLSIQVHPDNEYALRMEKEYGKTEIWYILDVEEGASLHYGTSKEITKDEFRVRVEDNTILDASKKVPVHKGDASFIESGVICAIGEGIVVCEIQQGSNTTYYMYDFGRVSKGGKPRELHIEKTTDASNLIPLESDSKLIGEKGDYGTYKYTMMVICKYFTIYVYDVKTEYSMEVDEESSASFVIVDGEDNIESDDIMLSIHKGDSVFADANTGKMTVKGNYRPILSKV